MERVIVSGDEWGPVDVAVPRSFLERFRGLRAGGSAMLFRASSVHGFWMDRPLHVVFVDRARTVSRVDVLQPGTVKWSPRSHWVLELELAIDPPPVGARLGFYARDHGGKTGGLRDADRKPG